MRRSARFPVSQIMLRRAYLYSACLVCGIIVAWGAHHRIVRVAPSPPLSCVGWTVYLNSLMGLDPTNPDFEAGELGLLDDLDSARFLKSAAAEVRRTLGVRISNVSEVYLVPFQETGLKTKGFPFLSSMPYSVVFVSFRDGKLEEITVSERGDTPLRLVGFFGNSLLYAAMLVCICKFFERMANRIRARRLATST